MDTDKKCFNIKCLFHNFTFVNNCSQCCFEDNLLKCEYFKPEIKTGVELIGYERKRQIEEEGWDEQHDENHESGELLLLAACYIFKNYSSEYFSKKIIESVEAELGGYWDDPSEWIKYTESIKDLTKAGALIAAEIDRLKAIE